MLNTLVGGLIGVVAGVVFATLGWAFQTHRSVSGLVVKVQDLTKVLDRIATPMALIGERLAKVEITLLQYGGRMTKLERNGETDHGGHAANSERDPGA